MTSTDYYEDYSVGMLEGSLWLHILCSAKEAGPRLTDSAWPRKVFARSPRSPRFRSESDFKAEAHQPCDTPVASNLCCTMVQSSLLEEDAVMATFLVPIEKRVALISRGSCPGFGDDCTVPCPLQRSPSRIYQNKTSALVQEYGVVAINKSLLQIMSIPTDFPQFGRFPLEIRCQIWTEIADANQEKRVVVVNNLGRKTSEISFQYSRQLKFADTFKPGPVFKLPALLMISRESREVISKRLPKAFGAQLGRPIHFNVSYECSTRHLTLSKC